jgi:hypothetical protein
LICRSSLISLLMFSTAFLFGCVGFSPSVSPLF